MGEVHDGLGEVHDGLGEAHERMGKLTLWYMRLTFFMGDAAKGAGEPAFWPGSRPGINASQLTCGVRHLQISCVTMGYRSKGEFVKTFPKKMF